MNFKFKIKLMRYLKITIYTFILAITLLLVGYAQAAISPHINFMGKVTNIDGTELADGVYNMTFSLFTAPTGGSAIWSEELTADNRFSAVITHVTETNAGIIYTYSSASASTTLSIGQYLFNASTSENALLITV